MKRATAGSPLVPDRIAELHGKLVTPVTQESGRTRQQIIDEIHRRIGPVSRPSKMPRLAWGISADRCKTGSKLAKVEGTPCHVCYACKGRYNFAPVQDAMERRLRGYREDPDWAELMAIRILMDHRHCEYFRWFDSGDVQDEDMMREIQKVARYTAPFIKHWLPTQERRIARACEDTRPANLVVRISSSKLYERQLKPDFPTSFVGTHTVNWKEDTYRCPSDKQGHKCGTCRACWNPRIRSVEYLLN